MRNNRGRFDFLLFVCTYALAVFGVIAITAATYTPNENTRAGMSLLSHVLTSYYGRWQAIFLLLSPIAVITLASIDYRILTRMSFIIYLGALALLCVVLLTDSINGVRGWFSLLWDRTLQPSELAKIAIVLHLSKFLARKQNPIQNARDLLMFFLIIGLPLGLIFVQGEMGTAMVILVFCMLMLFMSGTSIKLMIALVVTGIGAIIPLLLYMRTTGSYRFMRILAFIDPSQASADDKYQVTRSLIAVGSGGLRGQGMFQDGSISALNYVPADHTDFIFSSIGETMGFIGGIVLLALYTMLILRMFSLAMRTADKCGQLIIIGIATMMFFHIFYNIGMTIGVTPVMGIPLPFVSYGGSNLIANMACVGLVLNVAMRRSHDRAFVMPEFLSGATLRWRKLTKPRPAAHMPRIEQGRRR